MMKKIILLLLLGSFLLTGCQSRDEEVPTRSEGIQTPIQGNRENSGQGQEKQKRIYTEISPDRLCPFTLEVYPETLYVGDPLYIRMIFQNFTDKDAYAYARPIISPIVEMRIFEFYLKEMATPAISLWHTGTLEGGVQHVWEKIKPGEKGITQYASLGFPGIHYGNDNNSLHCVRFDSKRWSEIGKPYTSTGTVVERATGQLVVVFNNGGMYFVPENADEYIIPPKQIQTQIAVSSTISIKAREQEEMKILRETFFNDARYEKQELERVIPIMTPGTLQNLLKYKLLYIGLKQGFGDELDASQILEALEKMENFLKPLNEIERENLKRFGDNDRDWIERRMRDNEKLLKRFNEVFGEKVAPLKIPSNYTEEWEGVESLSKSFGQKRWVE